MGVGNKAAASAGLGHLEIPIEGLQEILSRWSGRGFLAVDELVRLLAQVDQSSISDPEWTARDLKRRAYRIVAEQVLPRIAGWPDSETVWINALPAQSKHIHDTDRAPFPGISWRLTRAQGWPPRQFIGKRRERIEDQLLLTALRWTTDLLSLTRQAAAALFDEIERPYSCQLAALDALASLEPLASAESVEPTPADVQSLASAGYPWNEVAPVTETLLALNGQSLVDLASTLLVPDDDIRWRLFHLACLGQLLLGLRDAGIRVRSVRPLTASSGAPAYVGTRDGDDTWEIWFEAAGIWSGHRKPSPYLHATTGLRMRAARPLAPDILVLDASRRAMLVECKFRQPNTDFAAQGFQQVLAYAAEILGPIAAEVQSFVAVPESLVNEAVVASTAVGTVGFVGPLALRRAAASFALE